LYFFAKKDRPSHDTIPLMQQLYRFIGRKKDTEMAPLADIGRATSK
jgi:hypothetical protein